MRRTPKILRLAGAAIVMVVAFLTASRTIPCEYVVAALLISVYAHLIIAESQDDDETNAQNL